MQKISVHNSQQPDSGATKLMDSPFLAWAKHLDSLMLVLFIFGSMFLTGYNELRTLGITLIAVFLLTHLPKLGSLVREMRPFPKEIIYYTTWVAWAVITGAFIADDFELFSNSVKLIVQMNIMIWVIWGILSVRKNAVYGVFLAIIAGGLIQIATVFMEGIPEVNIEKERVYGLTENPNALGFLMIYTLFALLFLWKWKIQNLLMTRIRSIASLGIGVMCIYVIIASGSRKSFIALCLIMIGWLLFALSARRNLLTQLIRLVIALALGVLAYYLLPTLLENTLLAIKFEKFLAQGGGTFQGAIESNIRYDMYITGLKLFIDNPLFGVGLDNFRIHFYSGAYSHSDYIESLATTGLVGFILYQSFFFLVLRRAVRLIRIVRTGLSAYIVKMIAVSVLVIMWIGFGSPHYNQHMIYILLTTFCVLLRQIEDDFALLTLTTRQTPGLRKIEMR